MLECTAFAKLAKAGTHLSIHARSRSCLNSASGDPRSLKEGPHLVTTAKFFVAVSERALRPFVAMAPLEVLAQVLLEPPRRWQAAASAANAKPALSNSIELRSFGGFAPLHHALQTIGRRPKQKMSR